MTDRDSMPCERSRAGQICSGGTDSAAKCTERDSANHDAAPAATVSVESVAPQPTTRGDSDRADKAAPRPSQGTGDTPATRATRGEGSEQREGTEPVAWAVTMGDGSVYEAFAAHQHGEAVALAKRCMFGTAGPLPLAPLYRQPPCQDLSQKNLTLTDAEREAVAYYIGTGGPDRVDAALRGLLERLGGAK